LKTLPENSIDSVVTDPPYGLSFMGKKWDYDVPSVEFWKEVLRVLKPGGHVLSFGGTRTYHRMTVNIEDAGFEIRDQIMWLYGSGFPKSHNIGKAVDKFEGNEREVVGIEKGAGTNKFTDGVNGLKPEYEGTKGTSEWEGWGTALKPANEPICVARKPLSEKTIAENVLKWGTGGINIDGCRVGTETITSKPGMKPGNFQGVDSNSTKQNDLEHSYEGRFPANIILDVEAGKVLETQSKGTSRFFYCPKVSKKERNAGCEDLETKRVCQGGYDTDWSSDKEGDIGINKVKEYKNNHPTVKPIDLMAYLCRLITPPNGIVLDPFMGSGSTGMAAVKEGFRFCGMEMEKEYFEIAQKRIEHIENTHTQTHRSI
jgi:site-specific DNA-methyltransferase (adenine-specific)